MSWGTLPEFLRRMRIDNPSVPAQEAAQQCLDAATAEITAYLSWADGEPTLTDEQLALLATANYDRAAEHWRLTPFGALNTGPELPPVLTARDSFYRTARKLASLKTSWGAA